MNKQFLIEVNIKILCWNLLYYFQVFYENTVFNKAKSLLGSFENLSKPLWLQSGLDINAWHTHYRLEEVLVIPCPDSNISDPFYSLKFHFLSSSSLTSLYRCSLWASVSPQTPHVTSPCPPPPQSPLPAVTTFLLHVFYIYVLHFYFGQSLWPAGLNPGPQQGKHRVLTTGLPRNSPII